MASSGNIQAATNIKAGDMLTLSAADGGWIATPVTYKLKAKKPVKAELPEQVELPLMIEEGERNVVAVADLDGPGWVAATAVHDLISDTWRLEIEIKAVLVVRLEGFNDQKHTLNSQHVSVGKWSIGPFSGQMYAELAAMNVIPLLAAIKLPGLANADGAKLTIELVKS